MLSSLSCLLAFADLLSLHRATLFLVREHSSIPYLQMAAKILNLPQLCITRIMAKEATNPKPSCRDKNNTAWQFTKTLANVPLSTWELRNRPPKKLDFIISFLLSHTKLLTSIAYKPLLSYFMHRMTSLLSQQPLSARLSTNWQEWQFWLAAVLRSFNTMAF